MTASQAVNAGLERFVRITTKRGCGSGTIIANGFVLTCFHILSSSSKTKVEGKKAEVVAVDPKHDLCLLAVETSEVKPISISDVGLAHEVFLVGNANGIGNSLMFGRVCLVNKKYVYHDCHGMSGVSGSGLYDLKGNLIGVNSMVTNNKAGSHLTMAVPAFKAQKLLGKLFAVSQPTPEEIVKYGGGNA